jgi:Mg/Co/Ni transporter MgtE
MENEYTEEPDENQDEQVEIYSKWPIRLFSLFFSPIFGGVLLIINLRKAGYKQAIASVLLFSIGYTFITAMLLSSLGITGGLIPIIFNLMGGMILSDYFYKKILKK